jgi:hypothetical protein
MHLDSRECFAMSICGAAYCVHLQEVSEQIGDCSPLSFPLFAFPQYQNPQECLLIYVKLLEDGNGCRQVRIPDFECSLQMCLLKQGL